MPRFPVTESFDADFCGERTVFAGEVFHVARNQFGGAVLTPIARYFAWRPGYTEGVHEHCRVDCFVKKHPLAPEPRVLGRALVAALMREGLCAEPIWLSVHWSEEIKGEAFGKVFEDG